MSRASPSDRRGTVRAQTLARLRELMVAEGFQHWTVGDLASRLRCSRSTLYEVAGSKEQIIVAAAREFFRAATERIESQVGEESDVARRLPVYLNAVAQELRPASPAFFDDLASFEPARELYEGNTRQAARRVGELVAEGVHAGVLRPANEAFVGAAVATIMTAIQTGQITRTTDLTDADAYEELADLIVNALARR